MSDGFFGRLINLVRGAGESLLKDLEADNPEAVYQAAIEAQAQRYHEAQRTLNGLTARREKLEAERTRLQQEMTDLGARAAALAGSDDARALKLLEQKNVAATRVAELEASLPEVDRLLQESRETLPSIKEQLETLKGERDQMMAQLRKAREQASREEVVAGAPDEAADRALQSVRDRIERVSVGSGVSGSTPQAAPAVSPREAAKVKARAELEALKKAHVKAPAAPATTARTLDPAAEEDDGEPEGEVAEEVEEVEEVAEGAAHEVADEAEEAAKAPQQKPPRSKRTL